MMRNRKSALSFASEFYPGTVIEVGRVDGVSAGPLPAPMTGYHLLKVLFLERPRVQIGTVRESALLLEQTLRHVFLLEKYEKRARS